MANSPSLPNHVMTLPLTNHAQDHNSFVFSNLAVILAIVVLVVIVTVALNASVFYYLRRFAGRSHPSYGAGNPVVKPPPPEIAALPMIVFSEGMKLAGTEAECVICLSEFKLGEEINVLPKCHHGFHVKCIDGWWSALHFSCPTCRTRYSSLELEKSPSLARESTGGLMSSLHKHARTPSTWRTIIVFYVPKTIETIS